jgi:hypothetical protein
MSSPSSSASSVINKNRWIDHSDSDSDSECDVASSAAPSSSEEKRQENDTHVSDSEHLRSQTEAFFNLNKKRILERKKQMEEELRKMNEELQMFEKEEILKEISSLQEKNDEISRQQKELDKQKKELDKQKNKNDEKIKELNSKLGVNSSSSSSSFASKVASSGAASSGDAASSGTGAKPTSPSSGSKSTTAAFASEPSQWKCWYFNNNTKTEHSFIVSKQKFIQELEDKTRVPDGATHLCCRLDPTKCGKSKNCDIAKCSFVHPRHCPYVVDDECTKPNCVYFHIKIETPTKWLERIAYSVDL